MGINKIQFQKGLSMAEFMERYGMEDKCQAALVGRRCRASTVKDVAEELNLDW